jgi:hypothetical protein
MELIGHGFRLPTYVGVRWLFPRLLAAVYLIAFISWGVQHAGLIGEQGILPVRELMANLRAYETRHETNLLNVYPTLFWLGDSDAYAQGLIAVGCLLALLVMAGVWQRGCLALMWLGYLSLVVVGDVFMGFQWDALLLEAGLLAVWLAPGRLWQGRGTVASPPRGSVFLLHWLLFRLMLLSGWVKIAGGDEVWRDWTALLYHYETQPLPHALSWWAHQLPRSVQVISCGVMFGIELLLPWVIFCGRWGRLLACLGFSGLMVTIVATGNYNFFNLLTIFLSLSLLDDSWWPKRWLSASASAPEQDEVRWRWWKWTGASTVVLGVLVLTLLAADGFLLGRVPGYVRRLPESWGQRLYEPVAPLRSFNAYGLFQAMTTERPEIVIEVSDDGILWLPLEFRWKPGDPTRRPRWVMPHQPRLDWQMWFAALNPGFDPRRNGAPGAPLHWFGAFLSALLEGREPVWALLEPPPFPRETIRHVRAKLWRYQLTSLEERQKTGKWWHRQPLGAFSPTFSRR